MIARGTFIAVVGPSGAGKDTLIRGALEARPDLEMVRRVISRPSAPGTEDFESVTEAEFTNRSAAGDFVLSWEAHGLCYGIPATVEKDLAAGHHRLANLSRGAVAEARERLAPIRVIVVTAPDEVLATRLAARGRERAEDIAARLTRASYAAPEGPDVQVVMNDGPAEDGVKAFLTALPDQAVSE